MELIKLIVVLVILIFLLRKTNNEFAQGGLAIMCLICIIGILTEIFN